MKTIIRTTIGKSNKIYTFISIKINVFFLISQENHATFNKNLSCTYKENGTAWSIIYGGGFGVTGYTATDYIEVSNSKNKFCFFRFHNYFNEMLPYNFHHIDVQPNSKKSRICDGNK